MSSPSSPISPNLPEGTNFPPPLIMLSPPRSFSSVISTMLGEHPQIYGFPELHLFIGDTVRQVIDEEKGKRGGQGYSGPPGVLRSLAQIHDGVQTTGSVIRASVWLQERADWSTKTLMDYLFDKVAPRISLEKSPPTSLRPHFIERAHAFYPNAFFLHLTRHPLPNRESLREFQLLNEKRAGKEDHQQRVDQLITWHFIHTNILRFTATLPAGQTFRIKGEDILSDNDTFLPQIAEWMGLDTGKAAIEAMKHPENSPYARVGPPTAKGGNDGKFMRSPKLRTGTVKQPSLEAFFQKEEKIPWFSDNLRNAFEDSPLRIASNKEIEEQVAEMAALLGYW